MIKKSPTTTRQRMPNREHVEYRPNKCKKQKMVAAVMQSICLTAFVCLLFASTAIAQISTGGAPKSFTRTVNTDIPTVKMAAVDVEALLIEDEIEEEMGLPFRFGFPFDVHYTLDNSGAWEKLDDGGRIWRLSIVADGAYTINLLYSRYHIPDGAELYIYNEDRSMVLGAFTSRNNKDHGEFATSPVKGDVTIVEYYEPEDVDFTGEIVISRVVHGYKDIFGYYPDKGILGFGSSGWCNNNVICPEGDPWRDEIRSCAMVLLSSGTRWCSGSLVNNVRQDQTQYFLTAYHCLGSETTWIFMFRYESPTCSPSNDGPTYYTVQGSTRRSSWSTSDFGLLEITETIPDSFNVYYGGWSNENVESDSAVAIHHPSGDVKKISFDYGTYTSTSYLSDTQDPNASHWRIGNWEDGTTEPGSSGSPLYNKYRQVIGQLHGGYASCESITPDWYGKFSKSWNGGGSSSTRLMNWLDPDNTGATTLDGHDPFAGIAITHTPLTDTKDSLNDYEVVCLIESPANPIADSLLLWFQTDIDPIWHADTLTSTGTDDEYHGFIPAQSPGTEVSYYLRAHDDDGGADTTETFTFSVIDYAVLLEPGFQSSSGAVDDTVWYPLTLTNDGVYNDSYILNVGNYMWPTTIWDETSTTEISNLGPLDPDESAAFQIRVIVPTSNFGDEDQALVTVTSVADPSVLANAIVNTISAGQPLGIPFFDDFPTTTIDNGKWIQYTGVIINDDGLNEPSEPYSANFDGGTVGADTLASQTLNLSGLSGVNISYHYQRTGGSDSPETGDDLFVEYFNSSGQWILLHQYPGSGEDMGTYEAITIGVPGDGYHSAFRLRFHNIGSPGPYDDWFVDDIRVDYGPAISATPLSYNINLPPDDSTEEMLIISNAGPGGLSYSIDIIPDYSKFMPFDDLLESGRVNPAHHEYTDDWQEYIEEKDVDNQHFGPEVKFDAGGPDNFGYIWIDSDEAGGPQFDWIDILATGTDITSGLDDDNFIGPYPIGFEFLFYDSSYEEFYVSSNGFIGFGPVDGYDEYANRPVPTTSVPNNMLMWCWDDLDITNDNNPGGKVLYQNVDGALVIQFYNYPERSAGLGDVINAEVILYPNDNIRIQYLSIAPSFISNESTVGIEGETGTDGLQIAYNTLYLHDSLTIEIIRPLLWLDLAPTSGSLLANESDTIDVKFNSVDLDSGVYQSNISIASNDPDPEDNPLVIPVELTVTPQGPLYLCGDADSSGVVEVSDAVYTVEYIFNSGPSPNPYEAGDVDCSEIVEISDVVYLVDYIFNEGPEPCADCPQ